MTMLKEDPGPCKNCRVGLHRICERPMSIPTLYSFVRGRRSAASETLTCCDRKEFWIDRVYD